MERKGFAFSFCVDKCDRECRLPGGCKKFERFVNKNRKLTETRALEIIESGEDDLAVIFHHLTMGLGRPTTHLSAIKPGEIVRKHKKFRTRR